MALLTSFCLPRIEGMLLLNAVTSKCCSIFIFIINIPLVEIFCSPFTCKNNWFCLFLIEMNTQFVINKPVTKVFKAFNESLWYPTKNLHWRINDLYIVTNDRLGKHSWTLHSSPMDVLTLLAIYLKCSPKFYFSSKNKPRCFWYWVCITWLLLKINTGWLGFLIFWEKITLELQ